jgi:hypothetical protein
VAAATALAAGLGLPSAADAEPRAVDFSRSINDSVLESARVAGLNGAARGWKMTKPITTRRSFDIVGFTWRKGSADPALQVRSKARGKAWTRWVDVPVDSEHGPDGKPARNAGSDPVWTGDANAFQLRFKGSPADLRARLVSVSGVRTPPVSRRVRAAGPGSPPAMVMRDAWGAKACPPRNAPSYGRVDAALVHHTAGTSDYTPEQSASVVLGVCRFHRNSRGWADIGYNFLVDKYGTLFEGRAGGIDKPVIGAQAAGFNSYTTSVSNLGTYDTVPQTPEAMASMAALLRWKLGLHGVPVLGEVTIVGRVFNRIAGHRNANSTTCPGQALYDQLPQLREMTANGSGAVPAPDNPVDPRRATRVRATLKSSAVRYPKPAELSGTVTAADGTPIAGAEVAIEVLKGSTWAHLTSVTSDDTGAWSATVRAHRNRTLRAMFDGDDNYRPSASARMSVAVGPSFEVSLDRTRAARGERIRLTGTLQPRKRKLQVWVSRKVGSTWATVPGLRMSAFRGAFDHRFSFTRPGRYRLAVVFPGDTMHARSRSPFVFLTVSAAKPRTAPTGSEKREPAPKNLAGRGVTKRGAVVTPPRRR